MRSSLRWLEQLLRLPQASLFLVSLWKWWTKLAGLKHEKTNPAVNRIHWNHRINLQILMWSMDCAEWHLTERIHLRLCSRQIQALCCTLHRTTARRCPDESQCSSASHQSYPAGQASSCGRWSHFDLTIPASCTEKMIWENGSHLSKRRVKCEATKHFLPKQGDTLLKLFR